MLLTLLALVPQASPAPTTHAALHRADCDVYVEVPSVADLAHALRNEYAMRLAEGDAMGAFLAPALDGEELDLWRWGLDLVEGMYGPEFRTEVALQHLGALEALSLSTHQRQRLPEELAEEARCEDALAEMRAIDQRLNFYGGSEPTLAALGVTGDAATDPWGRPYELASTGGATYVRSLGSDPEGGAPLHLRSDLTSLRVGFDGLGATHIAFEFSDATAARRALQWLAGISGDAVGRTVDNAEGFAERVPLATLGRPGASWLARREAFLHLVVDGPEWRALLPDEGESLAEAGGLSSLGSPEAPIVRYVSRIGLAERLAGALWASPVMAGVRARAALERLDDPLVADAVTAGQITFDGGRYRMGSTTEGGGAPTAATGARPAPLERIPPSAAVVLLASLEDPPVGDLLRALEWAAPAGTFDGFRAAFGPRFLLAVEPVMGPVAPRAQLWLDVRDEERARAQLEGLPVVLNAWLGLDLEVSEPKTYRDVELTTWRTSSPTLSPTWGILDGRLLFALHARHAREVVRGDEPEVPTDPHAVLSLARSELESGATLVWIDWAGLLENLYGILGAIAPLMGSELELPVDWSELPTSAEVFGPLEPTLYTAASGSGGLRVRVDSTLGPMAVVLPGLAATLAVPAIVERLEDL